MDVVSFTVGIVLGVPEGDVVIPGLCVVVTKGAIVEEKNRNAFSLRYTHDFSKVWQNTLN